MIRSRLALGASAVALLAATLTATPAFADATVKFSNKGTNDCLDAWDGKGRVISIECNEDAGKPEDGWQVWRISDIGRLTGIPGTYRIRNIRYPDKCLGGYNDSVTGVRLVTCDPNYRDPAQWWVIDGGRIRSYAVAKEMLYDEAGTLEVRLSRSYSPDINAQWNQYSW